ncbi:MAG: PQQ-binding-like beta-propeller repeat protein [Deltaproteobacteria bacterium]
MNSLLIALGVFVSGSLLASQVDVFSQWVQPSTQRRDFEMTQERTRPVMMGDVLYSANLAGEVFAVHRFEGYRLWERKMAAGVEGALAYGRSKVIVGDLHGNLVALNSRDGSDYWKFKIGSEWLSPPAISRDKVFAVTSNDELYALSETQGKELWHYSHRGDEKMTVRGVGGPIVFGNEIFQGFSNGDLAALSTQQGKVLWVKKLKSKERFYDIDMSPYVDEKSVIVGTFDGKVYSLDRLSGSIQWVFPVGSYGGFWVEDDRVYFSGLDRQFYCLDRNQGTVIWKTPFEAGVGATPSKSGDYLIFTTSEDPYYIIQASDGKVVWKGHLGAGTLGSAMTTPEGWFYILSNFGNLYALQLSKNVYPFGTPKTVPSSSAILRESIKTNSDRNRS